MLDHINSIADQRHASLRSPRTFETEWLAHGSRTVRRRRRSIFRRFVRSVLGKCFR